MKDHCLRKKAYLDRPIKDQVFSYDKSREIILLYYLNVTIYIEYGHFKITIRLFSVLTILAITRLTKYLVSTYMTAHKFYTHP